MRNALLSDNEFLAGFEAATLTGFHHADHIRAAWIYLRRLPFPQATERMAQSLRHFAASKSTHQKYHETITHAWMLLVADGFEQDRQVTDFNAFTAAHPELLDIHTLDRFDSSQSLATHAARASFVPPDLSPLSGSRHKPQH